jgi:hypothetical protein
MTRFFATQQFVREFFEALIAEFKRIFGMPLPLEILEDHQDRLIVLLNRRRIVADRAIQSVTAGERLLAPFKAITSIEIRLSQQDDEIKTWVVSLCLLRGTKVKVWRTRDDLEASLLAAKLSTITEKEVVSVS